MTLPAISATSGHRILLRRFAANWTLITPGSVFGEQTTAIGSYARHYYDLSQLAERPEVLAMLKSDEYTAIKSDYDAISTKHFGRSYFAPTDMSFANSDAIFPPSDLSNTLGKEYEQQCRLLCYGSFPSWDVVLARFENMKSLL